MRLDPPSVDPDHDTLDRNAVPDALQSEAGGGVLSKRLDRRHVVARELGQPQTAAGSSGSMSLRVGVGLLVIERHGLADRMNGRFDTQGAAGRAPIQRFTERDARECRRLFSAMAALGAQDEDWHRENREHP